MGAYVVIDGMDGSGKGTQLKLLERRYPDAVFTREPGGTPFAEEIRKLVRDNPLAGESTPLNNFLLFWAARDELMHNTVMPALRAGKTVFSDRGDSSTFAFQICGEQHGELRELFGVLRRHVYFVEHRRRVNLYVILDLPAEIARARALQDAERLQTHFDVRDLAYYQRVRQGFHKFADVHPDVRFVDANQPPENVFGLLTNILEKAGILP